ncbi:MAG: PilZ domain-containing protein [Candidatus Contendobacter sp.]|nr:PilZ domain-containing protein [Candidatus Contendobacter sp.]
MLTTRITPDDQRKFKRHPLMYYLNTFDFNTKKLIGNLIDISIEGAMIFSENPITCGEKIKLHIELPAGFLDGNCLDVEAEMVRNIRDINTDYHNIGFHFINLDSRSQEVIESLIHYYVF